MITNLAPVLPLRPAACLNSLIEAIGDGEFEAELVGFLNKNFGADHCALFGLDGEKPQEFAAVSLDGTDTEHQFATLYLKTGLWRRDPIMDAARQIVDSEYPNLICLDTSALEDRELREMIYPGVDARLLLCGRSVVGHIGLSILRSHVRGEATLSDTPELREIGPQLLSILGKHASMRGKRRQMLLALTSLDEVMDCVGSAPEGLPRREVQVCSRRLYGISSLGIALDLGIGEQTVLTYRKRIYRRLSIGSQRELMIWYMGRWNPKKGDVGGPL